MNREMSQETNPYAYFPTEQERKESPDIILEHEEFDEFYSGKRKFITTRMAKGSSPFKEGEAIQVFRARHKPDDPITSLECYVSEVSANEAIIRKKSELIDAEIVE